MKEELGFSRRRTFLVEFSSTQDLRPPPSWWGWGGMQEASGGKAFLSFFSLQETLYLGLFTRGASCRMQMWGDSTISLALRRQGCTSHWRLEGDDCYKMQLRETLVFCLASRRQGLQGGDSSHWWRHTPVIQIGTPLAVGSHWCYRMQAQVENGKLAFCLGDTSMRVNCPRLQPGDTFQTFIGTDFTSDWDALDAVQKTFSQKRKKSGKFDNT